jgi:hypothetical protein
MSGFLHGGSALNLDIGVRNDSGAARSHGDVVQIDFAQAGVGQDGFGAVTPPAGGAQSGWADNPLDIGSGFLSVTGSVIAPQGHTIMATEEMTIRVAGAAQVRVLAPVGGIVVGDLLDISPTNNHLVQSGMNGGNISVANTAASTGLIRGVALQALGAGATGVINVWLRPFGGLS